MKKGKGKKILAILMAALMVVGILPSDWALKQIDAATKTESISIPSDGLIAGTSYGDTSKVSFTVLENMAVKADSAANVDGIDYPYFVQGSTNASPKAGAVPTAGAAFKITAAVDSTISFVTKSASKTYHFVETSDSESTTVISDQTDTSVPTGTLTFSMSAGHTYYFYLDGSKACVYGISYTYEKASDYQKTIVDLSAGLLSTETYGSASLATFSVLEDMALKADSAANVDGVDYPGFVQGSSNASPKNGQIPTAGAAFKISAAVDSTITFVTKSAAKTYHFVDTADADPSTVISDTTDTSVPTGALKFDMTAGHTYYFYLDGSKACVYSIVLEAGTPDLDWSTVAAPELGTPSVEDGTITVPYTASIGDLGGEMLTVNMYNGEELIDSQISKASGESGTVEFNPATTGDYSFSAVLSRTGEADKTSNVVSTSFVLPLGAPIINTVTSKGAGSVEVGFSAVDEAESYEVLYSKDGSSYTSAGSTTDTVMTFTVPETNVTYSFKVVAKRGTEAKESEVVQEEVLDSAQTTWNFSAFGQGVSTDEADSGFSGSANDGSVQVWGQNGKGKIVPASTDGLSFYYTAVPSSLNFTLSAKVTVDSWTYSNGQEGFGLMAADRVGTNGDASVFWNNSYMDTVTKVEYYADSEGAITDDTTASKISMKLGVGSQAKTGVTTDNLARLEASDTDTINNEFSTIMSTLETSCALRGAGTYNLVGNYTNTESKFTDTVVDNKTTFTMTIQRNNTGYFVSYTDEAGNTTTQKYYDTEALDQLDADNVYVGFFASRYATATFSDISLTTIDPSQDTAKEEQQITTVTPSYQIVSASTANTDSYNLEYVANADGNVVVTAADGTVIAEQSVVAGQKYYFPTTLTLGENSFTVLMTPNADYVPGEYQVMANYDAVEITKTVTYNNFDGDIIYVGPEGTSKGVGSKESPVDIYTATKFAKAGQTVVILAGTYNLTSTVTIPQGTDGSADAMINLIADPESSERPVFDFGDNCEGLVVGGDYWYIAGFDVTNSANGKDGIRLSASNCVMDNLHTYRNGNTGLQISRFASTDEKSEWPANNLILNCTSYGNADSGYEDADGFAAKLTIGEGNVFDGCIAYNNADDGWDCFAKPETGSIGAVTIQNCVAYANGYLEDGTIAGNGNGFKLGGSSLSGYHKLINSVAFDNKSKGIDSNSCPDIQVENCTTFNNASYNVALYTNDAANTDFNAAGIISFRTQFTDIEENFKLKGTQDESKVYQATDYYWNYTGTGANNSNGTVTTAWFESADTLFNYNTHVYSSAPVTRDADGSINMGKTLVLSEYARSIVGTSSGATVTGRASKTFTLNGAVTTGLLYVKSTTDVKTGDVMNAMAYLMLLVAAAGCLVLLNRKKRNA